MTFRPLPDARHAGGLRPATSRGTGSHGSAGLAFGALLVLAGCSNAPVQPPSANHLRTESLAPPSSQNIPQPVRLSPALPKPKPAAPSETYSVVVDNIKVQELLFALARDAKLNIDVHPGIQGVVTLNAINQTLQQLLNRIANQVDMRWEFDGPNLVVMPDSPFLRTYKVDYVNMSRDVSSMVSINTQIASTSTGATTAGGGAAGGGNNSSTTVNSKAQNNFWVSLEKNLKDILRETDKILPEGSSETVIERADQQSTTGTGAQPPKTTGKANPNAPPSIAGSPNPASLQQEGTTVVRRTTFREAASVIVNPEAGVVIVRASARQHEKVQEYIDQVTKNSRRQVMIEATIAEVNLNNQYDQGIDWSILPLGSSGFKLSGGPAGFGTGSFTTATDSSGKGGVALKSLGIVSGSIKLLETFGTVKVLSSPKISVLNNQTAMLKVVNNFVYFHVEANTTTSASGPSQTTVTTTPNSVSIGLVMSVTPQISEDNIILLNVRPTISSLSGPGKIDPNPSIPVGIQNIVPEIQTREMESMLRLNDGEIAIMGGLMEDKINNGSTALPGLSNIPGIGTFFTSRSDVRTKTELVIFLKPTIIRDPSIAGDYSGFRDNLPDREFFKDTNGPQRQVFRNGSNPQ